MIQAVMKIFDKNAKELARMSLNVVRIRELEPKMRRMSDKEFPELTRSFRIRLAGGESMDAILPEAFAAAREAAKRTIGQRHYDAQLIGGITLHEGRIAEMKTGEGKTLAATAAVYLNALDLNPEWTPWARKKWGDDPGKWVFAPLWPPLDAKPDRSEVPDPLTDEEINQRGAGGVELALWSIPVSKGVHVVTVNDYLARRDREWMGGIYEFLGLTVGVIQNQMEYPERHDAYWCDITYGTNNEFGFDYLRDNMVRVKENMVQRGHNYAIVDEVDSILIDEARTPLIISGAVPISRHKYREMKPRVESMAMAQEKIVNNLLRDAEKWIEDGSKEAQAIENLAHVLRASPKNPRLLTIFEDPQWKKTAMQSIQYHKSKSGGNDIHEFDEEMYYTIDELSNTVTIQTRGEDFLSRGNPSLFKPEAMEEKILEIEADPNLSHEEKFERVTRMQAEAEVNNEMVHNIHQLVKAYALFQKDVEYVIKDGKIVIVDEFTGRLMPGRRYSDGLHEALEAKENVKIEKESQTLATITLQNYFRLYAKLAGMTGTAKTEEEEFIKIYGMDVIIIPTNEPMIRKDYDDAVYKTERAKFNAVVEEIEDCYSRGQPVLVGTVSVEKSEQLSRELKSHKVPHNVLNAKNHEREAEIIAEAGQLGKVTIATNMAGRGTDIVLGEFAPEQLLRHWQRTEMAPPDLNPADDPQSISDRLADVWAQKYLTEDELSKAGTPEEKREALRKAWRIMGINPPPFTLVAQVPKLGGLHIIGTERHESRRIDNQLRGRSGRQGDQGSSRFYISLEDDLMRMFGSDRIISVMNRIGVQDDEVIAHKFINKSIENAQRKVEYHNFQIRKHVLDYDDVMNVQRDYFYKLRQRILEGMDVSQTILEYIQGAVDDIVEKNCSRDLPREDWDVNELLFDFRQIIFLPELTLSKLEGKSNPDLKSYLKDLCEGEYKRREKSYGSELMRELERAVLLRSYDRNWIEHLLEMDGLKEGIGLRAYGNVDPLVAYKKEAMDMFHLLMAQIRQDVVKMIFRVELTRRAPETQEDPYKNATTNTSESGGTGTIRRKGKKVGRNDPCPCGSGKKYKKCCGANA